ncbi:hypothetical protein HU200_041225 [Digitaria exilis]|uniref:Uncharacterized protein n=1 Tax=Digitaria exilis TaxID=1010633 RepID=A0A835EG74_9POAL|nr:hypothetical protein HU200_041225 [Digitaria exilis]
MDLALSSGRTDGSMVTPLVILHQRWWLQFRLVPATYI